MDNIELKSLLEDVEEEVGGFGGGDLKDGVYHTRLSAKDSGDDGHDYYRMAWVTRCGQGVTGKHASVFVRWFNENATSQGWMRKIFWGQFIKPLTTYIPANRTAEVSSALNALRTVGTPYDFQAAMAALTGALDGIDIYIQQKTKEEGGLPNFQVIPVDKRTATCACALETVTV